MSMIVKLLAKGNHAVLVIDEKKLIGNITKIDILTKPDGTYNRKCSDFIYVDTKPISTAVRFSLLIIC